MSEGVYVDHLADAVRHEREGGDGSEGRAESALMWAAVTALCSIADSNTAQVELMRATLREVEKTNQVMERATVVSETHDWTAAEVPKAPAVTVSDGDFPPQYVTPNGTVYHRIIGDGSGEPGYSLNPAAEWGSWSLECLRERFGVDVPSETDVHADLPDSVTDGDGDVWRRLPGTDRYTMPDGAWTLGGIRAEHGIRGEGD
jgi:hypothetical protein